jgi:hypothetical protein
LRQKWPVLTTGQFPSVNHSAPASNCAARAGTLFLSRRFPGCLNLGGSAGKDKEAAASASGTLLRKTFHASRQIQSQFFKNIFFCLINKL